MAVKKGLFVYPWTLDEAGVDEPIRYYKEQAGIDSLYVNCSYHSGRFFQPLSDQRVLTRHDSGISFTPDLSFYPESLRPVVDETAKPGLHERIRESCEKLGVEYNVWAVGLHNSTLARAHPEYAVTNVFGTKYDYALCPSQPVVRQYLLGLSLNIAASFQPASIAMETPNFLGFVHGHHHELILSRLGPVAEYLLSLCFCDECRRRASEAGIDTEELANVVRQRITDLTERERGGLSAEFTQAELASLLVEEPLVYAYTAMRIRSVTELVRELHGELSGRGVKLIVVPSVFTRPGSKAWMEGTGFGQLDEFVDGFMLLSYFPNPAWVKADIEWLRMFARKAPLYSAFNAGGSDAPDEATLGACVAQALRFRPEAVAYYNASLLTRTRLDWIGRINRSIGGDSICSLQ